MQKQNLQRKTILILLALVALFGTGLSCGGQSQEISLTMWKPFDSSDKWQEIISAYAQAHKGIRIQYTQKPAETYERDLLEAMAAGKGPDIFSIRNDWLPRFKDKIAPAPTDIITARQYLDTFVNVVSKDFLDGNTIYAIPGAVDVLVMYYNRGHLSSANIARAPVTWPELTNIVPRLTRFNGSGQITQSAVALGTASNINRAVDILELLMLQGGVKFYDSVGASVTLSQGSTDENGDNPAGRALRFYTQFAQPSSRVYTWNERQKFSVDAFTQNEVAMIFGYAYLIPALTAKQAFLDYGISGVPQLSENSTKVNLANYWAETVWPGSVNSRVAWDFLKFAVGYEQNKKYVATVKLPSSRRDVLAEQQNDPELGVFADNVFSAQSVTKPDVALFENILNELINSVNLLGLKPTDAVRAAEEQLRLLLTRYPINSVN